jgi:hypothetical protein
MYSLYCLPDTVTINLSHLFLIKRLKEEENRGVVPLCLSRQRISTQFMLWPEIICFFLSSSYGASRHHHTWSNIEIIVTRQSGTMVKDIGQIRKSKGSIKISIYESKCKTSALSVSTIAWKRKVVGSWNDGVDTTGASLLSTKDSRSIPALSSSTHLPVDLKKIILQFHKRSFSD